MTMFTNGFSTLQMPKDFEAVNTKDEFNELYLVNTKIPMSIKFSTTPTLVGLPEIRADIEKNLENNDKIDGVWKDAILLESQWTGLYFKNLADNDQCDEFEYIKEIKVLK